MLYYTTGQVPGTVVDNSFVMWVNDIHNIMVPRNPISAPWKGNAAKMVAKPAPKMLIKKVIPQPAQPAPKLATKLPTIPVFSLRIDVLFSDPATSNRYSIVHQNHIPKSIVFMMLIIPPLVPLNV